MTGVGTALPCGQPRVGIVPTGLRVWQQGIEAATRNGDDL